MSSTPLPFNCFIIEIPKGHLLISHCLQAYADSSMRLYHPLVLEVVGSILQEAAEEKQAVKGYATWG